MADLVSYANLSGVPRQRYDAARLLRELEQQFWLSRDARERTILADWIVPEYVAWGDCESAAAILEHVTPSDDAESTARIAVLRAEVNAMQGQDPTLQMIRGYAELADTLQVVCCTRADRVPLLARTLSRTEFALMTEICSGKTNAEIARDRGVPAKAVEHRLTSAYGKLGVRNRAEAAARFAAMEVR